jgi:hypothetical protein
MPLYRMVGGGVVKNVLKAQRGVDGDKSRNNSKTLMESKE